MDEEAFELVRNTRNENDLDRGRGGDLADDAPVKKPTMVHINFQQRTTRKCITIIQGLDEDLDFDKLAKYFKKTWHCAAALKESEEYGTVIQVQGDIRKSVAQFFIDEGIARKEEIKIHGF